MRALETEVARIREAYNDLVNKSGPNDPNVLVQQQKVEIQSVRDENDILKEILAANGIQYEPELQQRKVERATSNGYQTSPIAASSTGSHTAGFASNHNTTPPTSISTGLSPRATGGMDQSEISPPMGFVPGQQVYQSSSGEPLGELDRSANHAIDCPVPAMHGIFETDPQLQVDFILTFVISLWCLLKRILLTCPTDWKVPAANTQIISVDGPSPKPTTRTCRSRATP